MENASSNYLYLFIEVVDTFISMVMLGCVVMKRIVQVAFL